MADHTACKNCETELLPEASYCSQCGQKVIVGRYTVKRITSQTLAIITNLEKGFWHTLKELFVHPEKVIRDYWNGKTVAYYHPFRYIFIWASISVILALSIDLYDIQQEYMNEAFGIADDNEQVARQQKIQEAMSNYLNLIYIIILPFMGFFSYLFFKKRGNNYAEHLILVTYVFAQNIIIGLVTLIFYALNPELIKYGLAIGMGISSIYFGYVYHRLYKVSWFQGLWKSLIAIILTYLTMFLVLGIITFIIVIIIVLIRKATGL